MSKILSSWLIEPQLIQAYHLFRHLIGPIRYLLSNCALAFGDHSTIYISRSSH